MTHLEAAERLTRLRPPLALEEWSPGQFGAAAAEGRRRWVEAQELFGLRWRMFDDAVSVISPSFAMESRFTDAAADVQARGWGEMGRVALWFMRWARCPQTADYPNPYEPWIEIWEHGGRFRPEHGWFVDVFDAAGMLVGGMLIRWT